MAEQLELSHLQQESYDIFLCTRGLPDALTGETAAIRQLMSALTGRGCRVFFPSALPAETSPEELAAAMAAALQSAPVMIAAAVGAEGAADATARFLWKRYRESAQAAPGRTFLACVRDLEVLPEELQGAETLDMSALDFLAKLQERLESVLPERSEPTDPEPEETPEPEAVPEPEYAPEPESAAEETPGSAAEKRRKCFLALAIGAAALVVLGLVLLLFIKK